MAAPNDGPHIPRGNGGVDTGPQQSNVGPPGPSNASNGSLTPQGSDSVRTIETSNNTTPVGRTAPTSRFFRGGPNRFDNGPTNRYEPPPFSRFDNGQENVRNGRKFPSGAPKY